MDSLKPVCYMFIAVDVNTSLPLTDFYQEPLYYITTFHL